MVAYVLDENLQHVRTIRMWRGEFGSAPPFDIGPDTLFVAYTAWAEMTCFMVLGWQFPDAHLRSAHRLSRGQQHPAAVQSGRDAEASRASACPTPAAPTGSRVGNTSTRRRSRKDIGEGRWREYGTRGRPRLLRGRRAHVGAAAARATARPRPLAIARRRRARAALVELQREGGRADPGARHADRHAAVEPGAGEQGGRHRRAAAAVRPELRQRRSDLHAGRRVELRAVRALARRAPASPHGRASRAASSTSTATPSA